MVLPGWNVTEPMALAVKLYKIIDKLQDAPQSARYFKSKIENFAELLEELQRVLDQPDGKRPDIPADSFSALKSKVAASQGCIDECEKFITQFDKLTSDEGKGLKVTGKALWLWKEGEAKALGEQVEYYISRISFSLQIKTFAQVHRNQESARSDIAKVPDPVRSETLPPYESPMQDGRQNDCDQKPKTPAEILGIPQRRSPGEAHNDTPMDRWFPSSPITTTQMVASPELGPIAGPSSRRISQYSVDSPSSHLTPSGTSRRVSQSPLTSPELSPMDIFGRSRQGSVFSLDGYVPGKSLERLENSKITLERKKRDASTKPIQNIEVFHGLGTDERYVLFSPPRRYNVRYCLDCSSGRRVIPHVEHPQALGKDDEYQVRLEKVYFTSERLPSRKETEASSAASIMSISTTASRSNSSGLSKEEGHLVLNFANKEDCKSFQELVIGPGVELQARIPAWGVKSKFAHNKVVREESKLVPLRLWRRERLQYLLFYANMSSEKTYKEFPMNWFKLGKPGKTSGKPSVKLQVKSPSPAYEPSQNTGLTRPIEMADLKDLEYLSIEFENEGQKANFELQAKFDAFLDDSVIPPFSFESRSTTV